VGKQAAFLGLSIHHIVLDGPSQQIVYRDLSRLLAAERTGKRAEHVEIEGCDEEQLMRDAVEHHVGALGAQPQDVPAHLLRLRLPFELPSGGGLSMVEIRRPLCESVVSGLRRLAAKHKLTLNAIFLGALAALLHEMSGQTEFAIMQTYLGRTLGQLGTVGSYSTLSPMAFSFKDKPHLLAVCKSVLVETQRMLLIEPLLQSGQCTTVGWELNDVRPVPRPVLLDIEGRAASNFKTCDLFFMVNEYSDGLDAVLLFDSSVYERGSAEEMVSAWMRMWQCL
jgi:hypothetical protein